MYIIVLLCFRRLSDVLKRKKPPKRGSGRKGTRHDDTTAEFIATKSPRAPTTRGKALSNKIGLQSKESKGGGATPKTSFLSSLNPTRWGRSNNSMPERPPPPKVTQKQPWTLLQVNKVWRTWT